MRKILSGVMGIVITGAVVTASAYALFTAQATVSGINFSTSTLSLLVSDTGNDGDYASSLDADLDINNAYPGFGVDNSVFASLFVFNDSSVPLDIDAQLTAATGWNSSALKDYVEVAVVLPGETPADEDFNTLMEWNANPIDLPGNPVAAGAEQEYVVFVRLPANAPDTLEGKSLTNITFTLTGTQSVTASPEPSVSPEPTPSATPSPAPTTTPEPETEG